MNQCLFSIIATLLLATAHGTDSPTSQPAHEHDHDHAGHNHAQEKSSTDDHSHGKPADDKHAEHDHSHDNHAEKAHTDEVKLSPEALLRYGVEIGKATTQPLYASIVAPGRVGFNTEAMAHVGSAVVGRVAELRVRLGDKVQRGDVLLVVESAELGEAQSDFILKRSAVDIARPAIEPARDAYNRARQLLDQSQGIAVTEVQKRATELLSAEGTLRAAEAAATAAESRLRLYGMSQEAVAELIKTGEIGARFTVTAPISGQVVEREVTQGELVRPDRDALMVIADTSTVWVMTELPEARSNDVAIGTAARVTSAASSGRIFEGKVTYVASSLNSSTRTLNVRVEIAGENGALKPGMFAQVTLVPAHIDSSTAVLAIPETAIQTVEGGPAVFVPVADEPNTFALRPVTIGRVVGGMVQVFSGLEAGESLVVSGSFILKAEHGKSGAAHEH